MWTYSQHSGLLSREVVHFSGGYSGHLEGLNNPDMQHVAGVGPIPRGTYTITHPFTSDSTGPYSMRLIPAPGNVMFGRSAFLIHGDNRLGNHSASHGCIIEAHAIRVPIWESGDRLLSVIV